MLRRRRRGPQPTRDGDVEDDCQAEAGAVAGAVEAVERGKDRLAVLGGEVVLLRRPILAAGIVMTILAFKLGDRKVSNRWWVAGAAGGALAYRKTMALNPSYSPAFVSLGNLYIDQGDNTLWSLRPSVPCDRYQFKRQRLGIE